MEEVPYGELLEERRDPNKNFISTLRFLLALLGIFAVFTYLFTNIFIGVQVVGSSMEPTLYTGDYLFVNTAASIDYGDIIVIETSAKDGIHDEDEAKWLIKRVIGLPGDTIRIRDGNVYRKHDGEADFSEVDEPYLDPADEWRQTINKDVYVEEGRVYVLGDHRSVSHDSRSKDLGTLLLDDVLGVVPNWIVACKDGLTAFFSLFQR